MNNEEKNRFILVLSIPLIFLVIIASCVGMFVSGTYSKETLNWTIQAIGQDAINLLLITPFLIITSFIAYRKNTIALYLWSGGMIYLCYTYMIYCFDIHFNNLFFLYCMILGLSFYSLMYFLYSLLNRNNIGCFNENFQTKSVSIYLLIISCFFIFLWLSEIIPAILTNSTPKTIVKIGTFTNPIQALDLSILLPGFIVISVLILKRRSLGLLLAPTALTFCILMDITIGVFTVFMIMNGQDSNWSIAVVMGLLALITIILLFRLFNNKHCENDLKNKTKYYYPLRS